MVLAGNGSRVVMFGGRDNEIVRQHIPKTYEVSWQKLRTFVLSILCKLESPRLLQRQRDINAPTPRH